MSPEIHLKDRLRRLTHRRTRSNSETPQELAPLGVPKSQSNRELSRVSLLSPVSPSLSTHLTHEPSAATPYPSFTPRHKSSRLFGDLVEHLPHPHGLSIERLTTRDQGAIRVPLIRTLNAGNLMPPAVVPSDEVSASSKEGFMSSILSVAHHLTGLAHDPPPPPAHDPPPPLARDPNLSSSTVLESPVQSVQFHPVKDTPVATMGNGDLSLASFDAPANELESHPLAPQTLRRKNTLRPKSHRRSLALTRSASTTERALSPSPDDPDDHKKDAEFHLLFKGIPPQERCLGAWGCALSKDILVHGKLYVSASHVCFNLNIFGWVTNLVIPLGKVVQIEKRSTALMFPNGMVIQTLHERHVFASFLQRDATFDSLCDVWGRATRDELQHGRPAGNTALLAVISHEDSDDMDDSSDSALSDSEMVAETLDPAAPAVPAAPATHAPTAFGYVKKPLDVEIINEAVTAPLPAVFGILFGDDVANLQRILEAQRNRDISKIPAFSKAAPRTRSYDYVKPLNGPIGPKQTKCEVTETIEKENFDDVVVVLQSTRTPDVPSGGSFSVQTRFYLAWGENNATKVLIVTSVEWTGKSWIKGPVESGSIAGQKESLAILMAEVKGLVAAGSERPRSRSKRKSEVEPAPAPAPAPAPPPPPLGPPSFLEALNTLTATIPLPLPGPLKLPIMGLGVAILCFWSSRRGGALPLPAYSDASMHRFGQLMLLAGDQELAGSHLWDWVNDRGKPGLTEDSWEQLGFTLSRGKRGPQDVEEMLRLAQLRLDQIRQLV